MSLSSSPSLHSIRDEMQAGVKHDKEKVLEKNTIYLSTVMFQDI